MKKFITKIIPSIVIGALCTSAIPAQAKTELIMSSWAPTVHWMHTKGLKPWAEKINAATEGRISVRILPKPLAGPSAHFDLARKGTADISWGLYSYQPTRFKLMSVFELPLLGDNAEAASIATWRVFKKHLEQDASQKGVKILGLFTHGGSGIHHSHKSVTTLEDLKGQKVRIGGPAQKEIIESMGGVAVGAPQSKSYEMITSKAVDATLSAWEMTSSLGLTDIAPYHSFVPGGMYDAVFFLAMNEKKFNSLTPQDQAAIMSVSGEAVSRMFGQEFHARNQQVLNQLQENGQVKTVSPEFLDKLALIRQELVTEWIDYAKDKGYEAPEQIVSDFKSAYQAAASDE